jgi:diguanylate cyclase (GGDEF)-like protein/PAS domain S-box-containing protein
MAAVTVVPDPARAIEGFSLDPGSLAVAIAAAAVSVIGICLIAAFADRRSKAILHEQNVRLDRAINNMARGLSMFDASGRLLVCNEKYSEIYRLPAGAVKPGDTFRDVVMRRSAHGMLAEEPDKYCARVLPILLNARSAHHVVERVDGRSIAIASQPMPAGGWVATHEDITERLKTAQDHERTRKFLDTIVDNMPATLIVKKVPDLQYVLINRAGEEALGVSRSELIGKTAYDYFSIHEAEAITARDRRVIQTGEIIGAEYSGHTKPGGRRQLSARVAAIAGEDGRPEYVMTLVDDITERKRAEARVAHLALHSPLTDLPNRAAFNERLARTLELAASTGNGLAVLCIDLDRFKEINDVFGHSAGDACLRVVSERLRRAAHGVFLAHLGGDEFALVVADGPQPATAELLGDRLLEAVKEEVDVCGQRIGAALSIGVAIYPADGDDAETLLCNAGAALDRAKAEGRASMRFFEAAMDTRLRERRALQHDLRSAVELEQVSLHYQPQARIGGETTGFEALVRWQHPARGAISPGQFIPVAEESGLIGAIGEWILREACREAASWPKPLHVAVNFSPVQFRQCDLPDLVHRVLLETGLAPHRLEVEITESVLIGDFDRALAILRRLKTLGVQIAMDDFGTGYSSLSYLQSFPFDKIKIDRTFISNVDRNQQSAAIVRAVLGLGRSLQLPVVAEGVETKEQLAFLARERCEQVQGYLIGRPSPIATYAALVGRKTAPAMHHAVAG